jgi:hypothetical protein
VTTIAQNLAICRNLARTTAVVAGIQLRHNAGIGVGACAGLGANQMKFINKLLAGAVLAMLAANAQAAAITITNPSFETAPVGGFNLTAGCGSVVGCQYNSGSIPGWTVTGGTGEWQPGNSTSVFFNTAGGQSGPTVAYSNGGTFAQLLGATTVAGDTYTLSFYEGWRNDQTLPVNTVDLMIGGTPIAATGAALTQGNWTLYQATFTALTSGQSIGIDVANIGGGQGDFDNFSLSAAAIPEPAAWLLMLAGFGGLGAALRRRQIRFA